MTYCVYVSSDDLVTFEQHLTRFGFRGKVVNTGWFKNCFAIQYSLDIDEHEATVLTLAFPYIKYLKLTQKENHD